MKKKKLNKQYYFSYPAKKVVQSIYLKVINKIKILKTSDNVKVTETYEVIFCYVELLNKKRKLCSTHL